MFVIAKRLQYWGRIIHRDKAKNIKLQMGEKKKQPQQDVLNKANS